jgi:hypothetical protein
MRVMSYFICGFFLANFAFSNQTLADRIVDEIISTEKTYNKALKDIKLHFVDFIANDRNDQNLKNIGTALNISLGPMIKLSDTLISDMEKEKTPSGVAKAFIQSAPALKMYGPYAANYMNIMQLMGKDDFKKSKTVENLLASLKAKTKNNNDLSFYLIQPIQRLPRYVLLFKDLAKAHPGVAMIDAAKAKAEEMASYVNSYK